MSLWHCHDRMSGERFEVHGANTDEIQESVEEYIRDGIDHDTGTVGYDVTCTAVDGNEHNFMGEVEPKSS